MAVFHYIMTSMFLYFLTLFLLTFPAQSFSALAEISYKGAKGPQKISISLKEFQDTYKAVRQIAPNTPPPQQFFEEYIRYRVGLEAAYNDSKLIKNPDLRNYFADPLLRESFEQVLYKHFAEKKLKGKIQKLQARAKNLSKTLMLKFYKSQPEFDVGFILVSFPAEPSALQVKEARARAEKIFKEAQKSKKPWPELVDIYSDDRMSGKIRAPRGRQNIYPTIYDRLKTMKNGQTSEPLKTPMGFYIVKLYRKLPFAQADQTRIRSAYFDQNRAKALKQYFNSLKSKYKVSVNQSLFNKIK